jgi:hypothetical protein
MSKHHTGGLFLFEKVLAGGPFTRLIGGPANLAR